MKFYDIFMKIYDFYMKNMFFMIFLMVFLKNVFYVFLYFEESYDFLMIFF